MRPNRRIVTQLAFFVVITVAAGAVMVFNYMRLPELLFGAGHYRVTVELPAAAGLYKNGNVTYRGTEVGRVLGVRLSGDVVLAELSLQSGISIPADLDARVHSQSAIGEQYVALVPRVDEGPSLKDGDVIGLDRTSVPPDINGLLNATNAGLAAVPGDNLQTAVDEAYQAFGGLGPELSRLVRGSTTLATDARRDLGPLTGLIEVAGPVLDSQTETAGSVGAWAAHLADLTAQVRSQDAALTRILEQGPAAADELRRGIDRVSSTVPVLLANLVSTGQVALTYRSGIEQLLVLLPQNTAVVQAAGLADRNIKSPYKGGYLSFNLNVNLPPICSTGYLPAQQRRAPSKTDNPARPTGDIYCRIPQDAPFNVRGARNLPCQTRPGKRAPTVRMCESDENYVPLNDGFAWKGDPNATLTGQDVPQVPPPPAPMPIAVAEYDPATGEYIGPDGQVYTQRDLSAAADGERSWQSMLLPAAG
ncbi:MCE family protein [Mycolicibacterium alvei]|uniref:Mammalian cell entry protein n=1 Tax=Mycolicibacterium alvei TaxID=67081 RepID=A0A6N4URR7_9MYCO|nr:MlaD family protein [Mycolicibacterium alvei]MCV7002153.1 MCE family protein [Mycolicibacterium alvei]BBX26231.1 mammalian cell entry protein [Mycolicibacterium alvei]